MRTTFQHSTLALDVIRSLGRRRTMTIGGILFLIGAGLQAGSVHLGMLIVGRVMLGASPSRALSAGLVAMDAGGHDQ